MAGTLLLSTLSAAPALAATTDSAAAAHPAPTQRLTNLDHLDWLTDRVAVPDTAAHTTYRLAADPQIGVIWVYADARDGGTFERVGGGGLDPATGHWGQGSYDSDDMTRAAVVYLREWQATGNAHAKEQAYQQLRGVAYFQTATGPHAGEGVLWMQPDGSLNPTPTPPDSPNPADSDASYWLARTLWAYGEGYAAFKKADPSFAAFLAERMQLTVAALNRDVLGDYGKYQVIHGVRVPAWLIVDGADASSEAMLGLAAYVKAAGPGTRTASSALKKLARGVAEMSAGSITQWPYRALLPWALSRSDWHAWGAQMPSGLAAAAAALHDPALLRPAIADAAGFTPQLLTSTGPVNGLLPLPTDATQIAYGADARVQAAATVGAASRRPGITALAAVAAGWFFGANAAGVAVYHPETGVTNDGVQPDGTVNRNSGAESTIHGLMSMQVLDAHPDLAALARSSANIRQRDGLQVIEAETGAVSGGASIVTPDPAWTGESLWSGDAVQVTAGSTVSWQLPAADQPRLVQPVVEQLHGATARTRFTDGGRPLGSVDFGGVGAQGQAQSAGMLMPVALSRTARAGQTTVTATTGGGTGRIDALMVMPEVATLVADGNGAATALLTSKSRSPELRKVALAGSGPASVGVYDSAGRTIARFAAGGESMTVPVLPGGFTLVTRT